VNEFVKNLIDALGKDPEMSFTEVFERISARIDELEDEVAELTDSIWESNTGEQHLK
jgi:hypothetical protein